MLTAEHVLCRRRGGELFLAPLDEPRRARALQYAAMLVAVAHGHVGADRQAVLEALKALPIDARDRRLAAGLQKLVLDRCRFAEDSPLAAETVRETVFTMAAAARREASAPPRTRAGPGEGRPFTRDDVLTQAAAVLGSDATTVEDALFADLPGAHTLIAAEVPEPERLLDLYQQGQVQAVLLRAVRVTVTVSDARPDDYRQLFRKLKFLQLLYTLSPLPSGGYRIEIDGPLSLFEAVTRYGLRLALALPAMGACGRWSLEADIRWGKERLPLRFRQQGQAIGAESDDRAREGDDLVVPLLERLRELDPEWEVTPSQRILDMPGLGVCVPDIELRSRSTGVTVFFELLGFWSRDAVWRRVELARAGLPFPVVFGVSRHLRVSEAVLDDDDPAALYVFARSPNARALLERVRQVAARFHDM